MTIKERFGITEEVDFFDYDYSKDNYMFFDPFSISTVYNHDLFAIECNSKIQSFFFALIDTANLGLKELKKVCTNLHEVNEVCLGMSRGAPKGKGIGDEFADDIANTFYTSDAIKGKVLESYEDIGMHVEGIDKDRISDITANIIKFCLIKYTKEQCIKYGLPTAEFDTGFYWDNSSSTWTKGKADFLCIDGKKYLLYPKKFVAKAMIYSPKRFFDIYVLDWYRTYYKENGIIKPEHKVYKNGNEKDILTKKVVREYLINNTECKNSDGEVSIKRIITKFSKEYPIECGELKKKFRSSYLKREEI